MNDMNRNFEESVGTFYDPGSMYAAAPIDFTLYSGSQGVDLGYRHYQSSACDSNFGVEPLPYDEWNGSDAAADTEAGCYSPLGAFKPQIYGVPVSAIAYDGTFEAMYVASVTQSMCSRFNGHRASVLAMHQTTDGSVYSSVAGHPEGPGHILNNIYDSVYGMTPSMSTAGLPGYRHVPKHAFKPPYGTNDPMLPGVGSRGNHHIGINSLVPTMNGYVASVSPAGVRVHSHGGLQVADYHVEGMICGTQHPSHDPSLVTHMTVGGLAIPREKGSHTSNYQMLCLDLWQGLRVVSSYTIARNTKNLSCTAIACNNSTGSILAGCSDGHVRMLDGQLRELARLKSHFGGVTDISVSSDGNLLATVGFGSRVAKRTKGQLYGFPDPAIFIYDIRYLGRGGIPHPFAGLNGGPRYVTFLPEVQGLPSNRLLVASGQVGGGLQIIVPFEEPSNAGSSFILPHLNMNESISSMTVADDKLALGTSQGSILQYRMAGFHHTIDSHGLRRGAFVPSTLHAKSTKEPNDLLPEETRKTKQVLSLPSLVPPPPAISVDTSVLLKGSPNARSGESEQLKALFSIYTMVADPILSMIGDSRDEAATSFGRLASTATIEQSKLKVSSILLDRASHNVDFLETIPTSDLKLNLFHDHRSDNVKISPTRKALLSNPNKFLYSNVLFTTAYEESLNRSKITGRKHRKEESSRDEKESLMRIPTRYQLTLRSSGKFVASFNYAEFNQSGILPGWDYPPTMPNAFVPPVLMVLYFIPEVRSSVAQLRLEKFTSKQLSLSPELAFLFHRIERISAFAMIYPTYSDTTLPTRLGIWAPLNFLSILQEMPEAEQLQILDGSPAAVDTFRRPEAFYRFLLYQLDKEMCRKTEPKLLDPLVGISFTSVNEFLSGTVSPTASSTRSLTVDLCYDPFVGMNKNGTRSSGPVRFSTVLQHTLYRETRLRAWNQISKSYETIVQRKMATSLPAILSLSSACAGRDETEGLALWRGSNSSNGHWLPEMIEIELEESGNVVVWELLEDKSTGKEEWIECSGRSSSTPARASTILERRKTRGTKRRYRLDAVLAIVRDDLDSSCSDEVAGLISNGQYGHHVVFARLGKDHHRSLASQQLGTLQQMDHDCEKNDIFRDTLAASRFDKRIYEKRVELAEKMVETLSIDSSSEDVWLLFNGYVVSKTNIEDAKAFDVKYKEPSLIVFRALDSPISSINVTDISFVSPDVLRTHSITNGSLSRHSLSQNVDMLPGKGELIAFDAEFVSVQDEDYSLTESGSKVTLRETRHALARISALCRDEAVLFDDYVLPVEPVVDYLTRFSGIVESDLHPKHSPHHLIGTRAAYLKLRCLVERGCIFVGHGLSGDFWTANLAVPENQIIDTVEIYHKPAHRYVSLRFLTNFVLKRDMQQDVHDSLEDARAAMELYQTSIALKQQGKFDMLLDDLYEYGQKADWKLGIERGR
jgi:PAB-dependent poly(A)-specific ribonuclease subunit 2